MKRQSAGFTLVEICVAMLIIAMVSSGVFSVMLTARTNEVRSDRRQQAIVFTEKLDGWLMQYAGDRTNGLNDICKGLCGTVCTAACYARITNDNGCGAGAAIHAFTTGCTHNADFLLPAWFTAAPFNGHMCYVVHDQAASTWSMQLVNSTVIWEQGGACTAP